VRLSGGVWGDGMTRPLHAECLSGLPGIRHGFFTREGGVSKGIYASLNCGPGSRDDAESVTENRRRVAEALGQRSAAQVVTLYQVHSATAVAVDIPLPRDALPKADALVTRTPGIVIGALAADCAPVLLADARAKVVAAVHAGWRGALAGVAEAAVAAMEELGARRPQIQAAIGPSIGQAAYEVGEEFKARFLAADPASAGRFMTPELGAKPHFDLPGYVADRLRRAGLGRVEQQAPCTNPDDSRFFSYRRSARREEPDYGRQISAIVVT
jgi:YfiH family protein